MGLILSSEVVVKNRGNNVDELFRQIQNSNLTTTQTLQLKHRLEALLHTMQEAELHGHFTRLESKVDNAESKVDNVNRATTTNFASMDTELQYQSAQNAMLHHQSAQNAVLLWQSTWNLAELEAMLLAERNKNV